MDAADNGTIYEEAYSVLATKSKHEEGVAFALVFCIVFGIMLFILLLLICKVWALRRSVVPTAFHINLGNEDGIFRPGPSRLACP